MIFFHPPRLHPRLEKNLIRQDFIQIHFHFHMVLATYGIGGTNFKKVLPKGVKINM